MISGYRNWIDLKANCMDMGQSDTAWQSGKPETDTYKPSSAQWDCQLAYLKESLRLPRNHLKL